MGQQCCSCCRRTEDGAGQYSRVTYYDDADADTEAEEMGERLQTTTTTTTIGAHASGDTACEEEEEGDSDEEDSVDDPLYYQHYRVISDPTRPANQRPPSGVGTTGGSTTWSTEDVQRYRYELALSAFGAWSSAKRVLIYEYEDFKSRHFNMEHLHQAEALLTEARRSQVVERKKELYRDALWHTTDLERKTQLKQEYNAFYRALSQ